MGRAAAEGLLAGGVLPVVKHMPGHGRAVADSHHNLPVVDADVDSLRANDFRPFRHLADMPMAMTAHVVFTAFDERSPATVSRTMVQDIMRKEIGFDGLIMTDDLSMKALTGTFAQKTRAALRAGVDMLLHCDGTMADMIEVAKAAPLLKGKAKRRAEAALARICHLPEPVDLGAARAALDAALAGRLA